MRKLARITVIAAAVGLALGCSKKDKAAPASADDGGTRAAKVATDVAPPAAAKNGSAAFLARWAEAQNQSDYPAYEAMYATDFVGIKRAGEKQKEYDRAAWIVDRARMFAKRMRVEIAEVALEASEDGVVVTFTQTWESGTFKDQGKKRLRLRTKDGGFEIIREEMLSSKRLPLPKGVTPDSSGVYLVVGHPAVLVSELGAPESAEEGAPVLLAEGADRSHKDLYIAGRKLKSSYGPGKAWLKRRLGVYGENGFVCAARVAGLYNARIVQPDARSGHFMHDDKDSAVTAKLAWNYVVEQTEGMANREQHIAGARVTVALLKAEGKKVCKNALWATDGNEKLATIVRKKAPRELVALAKRAVKQLKGYEKKWEKARDVNWKVHLLVGDDGSEFLSAGMVAEADPCVEEQESGTVAAVWRIMDWKGKKELVRWGFETDENAPVSGFIGSDGEPRFVSPLANEVDAALWAPVGAIHSTVKYSQAFITPDAEAVDCPDMD